MECHCRHDDLEQRKYSGGGGMSNTIYLCWVLADNDDLTSVIRKTVGYTYFEETAEAWKNKNKERGYEAVEELDIDA